MGTGRAGRKRLAWRRGARTSSCRGAWTCMASTRWRLSISQPTPCARPSGQRVREECEMEAELRTDLNSRDAPFHEALRLLRVSQGHTALRRVEAACRILRHGILGGRGGPNNVTKRTGVPAACLLY